MVALKMASMEYAATSIMLGHVKAYASQALMTSIVSAHLELVAV